MSQKEFIHRDVKPVNVVIGQGKKTNIVHLIDFGLAKRYICPKTGFHVPFKQTKHMVGTSRWLSADG
jgi:serine/threonine protein kinase